MVGAQNLLGIDDMVGHWEFTFGQDQVEHLVKTELKANFLAQNVFSNTWQELVFKPYKIHEISGRKIAVVGQAFPFNPIANPGYMILDWGFGIHTERMQKMVDERREQHKADLVVLLSHNGADMDKKMAAMVKGIDIILGGHTYDIMGPKPFMVGKTLSSTPAPTARSSRASTWMWARASSMAGASTILPSHQGRPGNDGLRGESTRTLAGEARPAPGHHRKPPRSPEQLQRHLRPTPCDALREEMDCEAAFSPGFRRGYCKLPGETITREDVMGQTAITYSQVTINEYTGARSKRSWSGWRTISSMSTPYYLRGGNMIRVGNIQYDFDPDEKIYHRCSNMRVGGKAMSAAKKYKVPGWAATTAPVEGKAVWEVFAHCLQARKHVRVEKVDPPRPNSDMKSNHGIAFPKKYGL